ncbi:hypothetical protein KCU73_g7890, partial [Aureobasidium melanogenum]
MSHFRIRELQRRLEAELARQTRINQLQESRWTDFEQGTRHSLQWIEDFKNEQDEMNIQREKEIRELRALNAELRDCVNTGVDDRKVGDELLETRIKALESLLGIENDEQESSPSPRHSASEQSLDRFTLLEEEITRMTRQLEVQAHEIQALKARFNTQPGQSAQSYEVNEKFGRATSSNKKRKVSSAAFSDRHDETDVPAYPATITSPGLWTHEY